MTNGSTPDEAWSFSNFMTSFAPELSERLKEIVKLPTKKFPNTTGENAADHQHALKNTREVKKIVKFLPFYRLRETYFGRVSDSYFYNISCFGNYGTLFMLYGASSNALKPGFHMTVTRSSNLMIQACFDLL